MNKNKGILLSAVIALAFLWAIFMFLKEVIIVVLVIFAICVIIGGCILLGKILINKKKIKDIRYVKKYSKTYDKILSINNNYIFKDIVGKTYNYYCKNLKEYRDIIDREKIKEIIDEDIEYCKSKISDAEENKILYKKYLEEIEKNSLFLTFGEIKKLPKRFLGIKKFMELERTVCNDIILKGINNEFNIEVNIIYTSPQGRNYNQRDYHINHNRIKDLFIEIEEDKYAYEKELKIKEELLLKKKEEKITKQLEKQKIAEERANKRKEEQKQIQEILKSKETILKQQKELEKKEEEFKKATQGHIYSPTQPMQLSFSDSVIEQSKEDNELSAWVKLKRLKAQFDNGEISFEEYQTKRKDLL